MAWTATTSTSPSASTLAKPGLTDRTAFAIGLGSGTFQIGPGNMEHDAEWWRDELKWGARHPWQFFRSWTWGFRHPDEWLLAQHYKYTAAQPPGSTKKMPWLTRKLYDHFYG